MKKITEDGVIIESLNGERIITLEDLLKLSQYDMELRKVLSSDANVWNTSMKMKDGSVKVVENYQIKAKLQPISQLAQPEIMDKLKQILDSNIKPVVNVPEKE